MFVRGDSTVLHPNFNMQLVLKSIQEHRISRLYLVGYLLPYEEMLLMVQGPSRHCRAGSKPSSLRDL